MDLTWIIPGDMENSSRYDIKDFMLLVQVWQEKELEKAFKQGRFSQNISCYMSL